MNDRQLLSFIKIVETGSFSKAAKDSFISVPAISSAFKEQSGCSIDGSGKNLL